MQNDNIFVHPTAVVEEGALLGRGVRVWHYAHVRATASLGAEVSLGKDVYIDADVEIGDGARIQNGVSVYHGVEISEWCFVGPYVVFTNDLAPRAGNRAWQVVRTRLHPGASLGAGAIIICGVSIGAFALVGAGAIVTHDLPPFHVAVGVPAKVRQMVCACAQTFLPLETGFSDLIRPCCEMNMDPRVLATASRVLASIAL